METNDVIKLLILSTIIVTSVFIICMTWYMVEKVNAFKVYAPQNNCIVAVLELKGTPAQVTECLK